MTLSRTLANVILTCALLLTCGCDRAARAPLEAAPDGVTESGLDRAQGLADAASPATTRGFYPLEIGNRWHYARTFSLNVIHTPPYPPPMTIRATIDRRLIGTESLFGREYVVEESKYDEGLGYPIWQWVRYRQDRSGLYEAAVSIVDPPGAPAASRVSAADAASPVAGACESLWRRASLRVPEARRAAFRRAWEALARKRLFLEHAALGLSRAGTTGAGRPGGVLADELTRLRYPLHPGVAWTIIDYGDLVFRTMVEAHEVLDLPAGRFPGYRTRILIEPALGPDDRVHFWFGASGFLRMTAHIESVATDELGNPIGTLISDEEEVLDGISLVERGERPALAVED